MKNVILLFTISFLFSQGLAQKKRIAVRVPLQYDLQKGESRGYINGPATGKKNTSFNFGLDLIVEKEISKSLGAYVGLGYFRNKFNIERFYDHRLLNVGTDSLSIGTLAHNYTYHLVRLPIGISLELIDAKKLSLKLGLENISSFSFRHVYNGAKPFVGANSTSSRFSFFGNSIIVFIQFSKTRSINQTVHLEPYVRLLNTYRSDPILFETSNQNHHRTADAFGVAIKYSFKIKKAQK